MAWLFWALLAALAAQRASELLLARAHERRLAARGGRLVADDVYGGIVALHVAFFVACAVEWLASPLAGFGVWTIPALVAFLAGQALRNWSMRALGDRWTTRIWIVPGEPPVARGPYRFLRHPIYVGVALEVAAFPLAFGLVGTAVVASLANAVLLRARIRREERALADAQRAA